MDARPRWTWRIERCAPDAPEALALIAGSEAELAAIYPPAVRSAFSPAQLIAAGVAFVLARDAAGHARACGGLAPLADADGPYGELKRIYVAPEARRRGAAKAVIGALEAEARALGLPLLRLETGEASPEAIALYAALGYRRRGPFGAYRENGSSVFMERTP